MSFDGRIDSSYLQHVLSLGLESLHQISVAHTYEERHKILYSGEVPKENGWFLFEALCNANEEDTKGRVLSVYTLEDQVAHIKGPYFDDIDTGPAEIWGWAHQSETTARFIYQENRWPLREWSYVMWDQSRLDALDILESPWQPPERSQPQYRDDEYSLDTMQRSWEARSKIYRADGRGWWDFGHESKVVWPAERDLRVDSPSENSRIIPTSVEEAKEAIRRIQLP